ncbi:MAG TPA: aminodeoxychorismate/anthranilate synthase component II [Cyclobacteriaceae bacterium]|nr:aminodeoxychorismate/anthranilate synthase component II [Cyclobacteriaceae bacterium]
MKVLILDNYDSFTYNLAHIIRQLKYDYEVHRNDKIEPEEIKRFDKILLSPGPGIPAEAGIMMDVIKHYQSSKSILGVCLGHQGIAEVYGGSLYNIPKVLHGVTSTAKVIDNEENLFNGLPASFQVTHYHSWAVLNGSLPPEVKVTAENEEGLIMGLRHTRFDVRGVQFHPESIMTREGPKIIENWLKN